MKQIIYPKKATRNVSFYLIRWTFWTVIALHDAADSGPDHAGVIGIFFAAGVATIFAIPFFTLFFGLHWLWLITIVCLVIYLAIGIFINYIGPYGRIF